MISTHRWSTEIASRLGLGLFPGKLLRKFPSKQVRLSVVLGLMAVASAWSSNAVLAQPGDDIQEPSEESVAEYKKLVGDGGALFNDGKWAEARENFEKAYGIHPRPVLLFNIASTYRREGNREEALKYYKKYLEVAPPDADYRGVAQEAVVNVEEQIAAEKAAESPPLQPAERSDSSGKLLRIAGLTFGVAGLASLSFGIYQGFEARELNNKFENLDPDVEWSPELQADFDRGESLERQAIIFSAVGAVAIAAGGALYVAGVLGDKSSGPEEQQMVLTPMPTPHGAGFALSGSF